MSATLRSPPDRGWASSAARAVLDAWRHITRVEIVAAFQFGSAAFVFHVIIWSFGMLQRPSLLKPLLATFQQDQIGGFTLMLAIVAADRLSAADGGRRAAYAFAVLASALVMASIGSPLAIWIVEPEPSLSLVLGSAFYAFCDWLVLAGTATLVYSDRRRAREARARMHAAELERANAARRTLETRLQAMQARVEPRFLFDTLAQVHDLYGADAVRGERMLDELIAYLRAAMPQMRDTSSTVAQEIELARAWLEIVRLRFEGRFRFAIDPVAAPLCETPMPAMMLLPLVAHAITHGIAASQDAGTIRIRSQQSGGSIQLDIADSGNGFLPERDDAAIVGIRERLGALYDARGSLALAKREGGGTCASLTLPFDLPAVAPSSAWVASPFLLQPSESYLP